MSEIFMILGFALAAYAIVANDSIQTPKTCWLQFKAPLVDALDLDSGIMVVTVT